MNNGTTDLNESRKGHKDGKAFQSNLGLIGISVVLHAIVILLICNGISYALMFTPMFTPGFLWLIIYYLKLPITSLFIAVIIVALRWTTVTISDTTITWKTLGKKEQVFPINKVIAHNEQISENRKNIYLRVFEESGVSNDYKLNYFSTSGYGELVQCLDVSQRETIPKEIVVQHEFEKFSEQSDTITWPKDRIRKTEKKRWVLSLGFIVALFIVFFLLRQEVDLFFRFIMYAVYVVLFIYLICDGIRLLVNGKRCLDQIKTNYDWLRINELPFNRRNIQSFDITSAQKKSDSIFPVQRFIKINVDGKKHVYWLGSSAGISYEEYEELTTMLDGFFESTPTKLRKKG